jgi:hypothetical protein
LCSIPRRAGIVEGEEYRQESSITESGIRQFRPGPFVGIKADAAYRHAASGKPGE